MTDFETFYREVHGHTPFAWQRRLSAQVLEEGWPDLIDLPTGAGKTSCVDIAIHALAMQPERQPRRIVYVVDRRLIVDQVSDTGELLSTRLTAALESDAPATFDVGNRLRSLSGDTALCTAVLRGGIPTDAGWIQRPDQPVLLVSTVDQVGSRLLFRGYGVSAEMRPLHAGLLGEDCLFILDEVHLSQPFAETLDAIGKLRNTTSNLLPTSRWKIVRLSATPGEFSGTRFQLTPPESDAATQPLLHQRMFCKKHLRVDNKPCKDREELEDRCIAHIRSLPGTTKAIVVNRVRTAVRIATKLQETWPEAETIALTGRMRALDRNDVLDRIIDRVRSGHERVDAAPPLIIVSTQTLEVGADFDFDAMVTEIASLDSLKQRVGRVDRIGALHASGRSAEIIVVGDRESTSQGNVDPVYGSATAATWNHLVEKAEKKGIDAGPRSEIWSDDPALRPPARTAPLLLHTHLDAWVQTNPVPHADPYPAWWLHGEADTGTDVHICWRSDLDGSADQTGWGTYAHVLKLCPPRSSECLAVPIQAFRAWLQERDTGDVADTEGALQVEEKNTRQSDRGPKSDVLRYQSGETERVSAGQVRPGDVVVIPSSWGGLGKGNWDPDSTHNITDLYEHAQIAEGRQPVLRLNPIVLANLGISSDGMPVRGEEQSAEEFDAAVSAWLHAASSADSTSRMTLDLLDLLQQSNPACIDTGNGHWVLIGQKRFREGKRYSTGIRDNCNDENLSFPGGKVPLQQHCMGVGEVARLLATRIGLSTERVQDLDAAGRGHDLGKVDPRFQCWLHGGDEIAAMSSDLPLAKSGLTGFDSLLASRKAAGYPSGARHEIVSEKLLRSNDQALAGASDPELVLHLVITHHGKNRPMPAAWSDPDAPSATITHSARSLSAGCGPLSPEESVEHVDRFWRLVRKYGWHGLAYLEAVLRIADFRRSEIEQEE